MRDRLIEVIYVGTHANAPYERCFQSRSPAHCGTYSAAQGGLYGVSLVEFTIVPVAEVTSSDPLWTTGVGDAAPVTLAMLPDDALVPVAVAVSHLLGPPQAGQALAGARGKEGLSQRQLAALTGIPQRHISEMEHGKRPIGKAHAKLLAKALKVDYRVLL